MCSSESVTGAWDGAGWDGVGVGVGVGDGVGIGVGVEMGLEWGWGGVTHLI